MTLESLKLVLEIAGLFGLGTYLKGKWKKFRCQQKKRKVEQRKRDEASFVNRENIIKLLDLFYPQTLGSGLIRYAFKVNHTEVGTSIFTRQCWLQIRKAPQSIQMSYSRTPACVNVDRSIYRAYELMIRARLDEMKIECWNAHKFRMTYLSDIPFGCRFEDTTYHEYRFTSGLLADELEDALIACQGNVSKVQDVRAVLPIRSAMLPNLETLTSVGSRICCGGIGVLFALKRQDHYHIPLQIRSDKVSGGRGFLALLPVAFHDAAVDPAQEHNIHWSIFRELYEEVYGGTEAERGTTKHSYNWYFNRDNPEMAWFQDNPAGHTCEITSFGFNAHAGNYEFGVLLAVHDLDYETTFDSKMQKNFETSNTMWVSSAEKTKLAEILTDERWTSESLFHFVEGLRRLKEIDPQRVALPAICVN